MAKEESNTGGDKDLDEIAESIGEVEIEEGEIEDEPRAEKGEQFGYKK
jgi:hypothetical protein